MSIVNAGGTPAVGLEHLMGALNLSIQWLMLNGHQFGVCCLMGGCMAFGHLGLTTKDRMRMRMRMRDVGAACAWGTLEAFNINSPR